MAATANSKVTAKPVLSPKDQIVHIAALSAEVFKVHVHHVRFYVFLDLRTNYMCVCTLLSQEMYYYMYDTNRSVR